MITFPAAAHLEGKMYSYVLPSFLTILLLYISNIIYGALFSPASRIPGPFLARFTRIWELNALHHGDFEKTNVKLHEKYGPVVRIAPNRFSVDGPNAIKTILGHGKAFPKSAFYSPFGMPNKTNLFSEPTNAGHAVMRRHLSMLYSTSTLLSYEGFIDSCTGVLVGKFREFARTGRRVHMPEFMQYYAFDVIGEVTVGHNFGMMEQEGDSRGVIDAIDGGNIYAAHVGLVPEVHQWVGLVTRLFQLKPPFQIVADFIGSHIEARQKTRKERGNSNGGGGERQDFLEKLLDLEASGKNTKTDTWTACTQNIAAGSDTTSIALSAVVYYLLKHPDTLAKLRQELENAEAARRISSPIKFKEAQGFPYLQAVIMETMRIHPAVGQPMTRTVPEGGATLAGHYFPAGAEVGINPWVIHQNKDIFGEDASEFRPERWLGDPTERTRLDQNFLAFGSGPRTCLGKNISMLELSKVIPEMIRHFDFRLVAPGGEWKTLNRWFVKSSYECRISERTESAEGRGI